MTFKEAYRKRKELLKDFFELIYYDDKDICGDYDKRYFCQYIWYFDELKIGDIVIDIEVDNFLFKFNLEFVSFNGNILKLKMVDKVKNIDDNIKEIYCIIKDKLDRKYKKVFPTKKNENRSYFEKELKKILKKIKHVEFFILKNPEEYIENFCHRYLFEKKKYYDKEDFEFLYTQFRDFIEFEKYLLEVWERKRKVKETHYVITLNKIAQFAGEEFLQSILSTILQNESQ